MKKKYLAIAIAVLSLQVTGCGAINLTAQERNVIAEYIANILLKHDKTYEPTLQYAVEVKEEEEKEKEEAKDQNQEKEDNKAGNGKNKNEAQGKNPGGTKDDSASDVYKSGIKVSCSGCSFYQTYPKNEKAILPLEASAGNTICVVSMKIKNTASSVKKIDFLTDNYFYQAEVGKKTYQAIQSLLINDIQYLDVSLKAGESYDAVVAFEIPKTAKNKKMNLFIKKGSKSTALKIK